MKYFLAIMACMLLDIIEPVGCSRDTECTNDNTSTTVENTALPADE